jgi:myo-inositol-1-phosphate synthase
MTIPEHFESRSLLLLVAGIKGAIGSTLAVAVSALRAGDASVAGSLTSRDKFTDILPVDALHVAGWDNRDEDLTACAGSGHVLPPTVMQAYGAALADIPVLKAPGGQGLDRQVETLEADIEAIKSQFPGSQPVLVNLLPAAPGVDPDRATDLASLKQCVTSENLPDLAYVLAAIRCGVPVVNFTPNSVELDPVVALAETAGVPLVGRDGKTGQTYFKVVLASALKARHLYVDGWYSMNILGNADGENLMIPERASGKLANKTNLLDQVLGYQVGERYGKPTHKVHIDYYPPRGDAKEAWDVIDFLGMFDLPMSLRIDLQGRDSILAAPMAIDLARWMFMLQLAGRKGLVPELAFFFKHPLGENAARTFQDQLAVLENLEAEVLSTLQ